MKRNVGGMDRTGRFVVGALFLVAGLTAPVELDWRIGMLILAAIGLFTASVHFCPVNAIFGINTCKGEQNDTTNK